MACWKCSMARRQPPSKHDSPEMLSALERVVRLRILRVALRAARATARRRCRRTIAPRCRPARQAASSSARSTTSDGQHRPLARRVDQRRGDPDAAVRRAAWCLRAPVATPSRSPMSRIGCPLSARVDVRGATREVRDAAQPAAEVRREAVAERLCLRSAPPMTSNGSTAMTWRASRRLAGAVAASDPVAAARRARPRSAPPTGSDRRGAWRAACR